MRSDNRELTPLESAILKHIPSDRFVDAERVEKAMAGTGYSVQDVVNALISLQQRDLIATGIDRSGAKPVAFFKRSLGI